MKLSLIIVLAGVFIFDFCGCSYWDHTPGNHRPQRISRDHPRPMRQHRHIQANNYHRHNQRIHRPLPPPSHRRRSRPHLRQPPIKPHRSPASNLGPMFLQQMSSSHIPRRYSPVKHFEGPADFFRQDEIIEQSKIYPTTIMLNEHTSSRYESATEKQPHGYLSSTYKGWKPIVKPYQDSYNRYPKVGKEDFSRKSNFISAIHPVHSGSMQDLNFNTLFREQTDRLKSDGKLRPDYSEHQGVAVPMPSNHVDQNRIQQSKYLEDPRFPGLMVSQSEEVAVIKKPFPKFMPKLKLISNSSSNTERANENDDSISKLPKFKFNKPRPRHPPAKEPTIGESGNNGLNGIPKPLVPKPTPQSRETSSEVENQSMLNLKNKLSSRGRVRVRAKPTKQESFGQSEELQHIPPPKSSHPFESHKRRIPTERPLQNNPNERQPNSSPSYVHQSHIREHQVRGNPSNYSEGSFTLQQFEGDDTKSPAEYYGNPQQESQYQTHQGPSEMQDFEIQPNGPRHPHQGHQSGGERRKKLKNGNKKAPIEQQLVDYSNNRRPAFEDDFYFPAGFNSDPSKNTGQDPVSFVTMPGSKPQVIHHTVHHGQHQQSPQQLYPINVMRSRPTDYERPSHAHASSSNMNFIPNNQPRFMILNGQNGGGSSLSNAPGPLFRGQLNLPTAHPSNHESTYSPHAFGSNVATYTLNNPYGPNRRPDYPTMTYPSPLPPVGHNPPPRTSPHPPSSTFRNSYGQHSHPFTRRVPFESSTLPSSEDTDSTEDNPYLSSPGYLPQTPPSNSFSSTSPRTYYSPPSPIHPFKMRPQSTHIYQEYTPGFNSAEYDKIPMQFADHLRPILREDPIHQASSTNVQNGKHMHQSPEVHPPANFFEDFFKPMDETFNTNPNQDLEQKPSSPIYSQMKPPHPTAGYDNFKSQSVTHAHILPHPLTRPFEHNTLAPQSQFLPNEQDISIVPSISYHIPQLEFDNFNPFPTTSWSKLKQESSNFLSSTESTQEKTTPHRDNWDQIDQSRQESVSMSMRVETSKSHLNQPHIEKNLEKTEDEGNSGNGDTTISSKLKKAETPLSIEEGQVTERVSSSTPTSLLEEDFNDSNVPKSIHRPGIDNNAHLLTYERRSTTEEPESSLPVTTFKSRRHFRRRRPDGAVRRRYFSSRVKPTTVSPSDEKKESTSFNTLKKSPVQGISGETEDEYESPQTLRHRRLFHRRRNLPTTQRTRDSTDGRVIPSTSTPISTESELVTYGESQWFRLKPADSSEQPSSTEAPRSASNLRPHFKSTVDKEGVNLKASSTVEVFPLDSSTEFSSENLRPTFFSVKQNKNVKEERALSPTTKKFTKPIN